MRLSRSLGPAYSATSILKSEANIDDVLGKFFSCVDRFAATNKPMDLDHYLAYAAYDILGEVLFSKSFGFLDQGKDIGGTLAAAKGVQALGATLGHFPTLVKILVNPFTTWLGLLPMGYIYHVTKELVEERERNHDARYDGLAQWLKISRENPERLSSREVLSSSALAIQGGSETVSCE